MTETPDGPGRKPHGQSFESWVDKQIRLAEERGDFDDLPGTGKPIPPDDGGELGWVRKYLEREQLPNDALLPLPLQLRRQAERLPETVRRYRDESDVRAAASALNRQIVDWLRAPSGPMIPVSLVDVDALVEGWRAAQREAAAQRPTGIAAAAATPAPRARRAWWRRLLRLP
ncbi:DUF1992 domain-containing protein [Rhodococcus sp. HNM0569]|uniref:DnaJ family domain-containing protein n=1 Tax=Rhodococcus sp. HNM0569 TaxID=2716340 RepID=UPI00146A49D2|nr:DUF1992 domain-containing protein [Rhodococcus sp. HNM0569]